MIAVFIALVIAIMSSKEGFFLDDITSSILYVDNDEEKSTVSKSTDDFNEKEVEDLAKKSLDEIYNK